MKVLETALPGVKLIAQAPIDDERGFFSRVYCRETFSAHGLKEVTAQVSSSFNARAGTVRGLHFQYPPAAETKYVSCVRGAIFDVVVDLRPESPAYLKHIAVELTAAARRGVYIPQRCAHGFMTLEDDTEVSYMIGQSYVPDLQAGLYYADQQFAIAWPRDATIISRRDAGWPQFSEVRDIIGKRMRCDECSLEN